MDDESINFVLRGDVVEIKTEVPKQELSPLNVLAMIMSYEQRITKNKDQLKQIEQQTKAIGAQLVEDELILAKVSKHKDWAVMWQESKLKVLVNEVKDECKKKVDDSYKHDVALSEENNSLQKYHQYRHFVATHEKVASLIHMTIARRLLFEQNLLENPWKVQETVAV